MARNIPVSALASASRTTSDVVELDDRLTERADRASFFLDVTAAAGTSPTLDVDVETEDPVSGEWFVLASFAQATGVTNERVHVTGLGRKVRLNWTLGGTNPDFTFSIGAVLHEP